MVKEIKEPDFQWQGAQGYEWWKLDIVRDKFTSNEQELLIRINDNFIVRVFPTKPYPLYYLQNDEREVNLDFSDIIKILRRKNNLRQEDLAEKLVIDRTVISDWENKVKMPQYNQLMEIADSFYISLDELTGRTPNKDINRFYNLEQKRIAAGQLTLTDLRQEFGMPLSELAQLLGVSRTTLKNWESNGLPNFEMYKKLFEYFELSKEMIMDLK